MKLTKFEHACLLVEQDGQKLIIDPGVYSKSLDTPENVVAIVVTHEHQDHLDSDAIERIIDANPDVKVIAHESLADKLPAQGFTPVHAGTGIAAGPFHLEFFGELHALVHPSIPQVANLGVMVNDTLYYPGDSFTNPEKPVNYLALPANAPWMKFAEAVDFMSEVKPSFAFPTHDIFMSEQGDELIDRMYTGFGEKAGARFMRLQIGVPTDI